MVLTWTGRHFNRHAGTVLRVGGSDDEFPVCGHELQSVMTAVEVGGSGRPLARFRLSRSPRPTGNDPNKVLRPSSAVEVVVGTEGLSTPHIEWIVTLASSWMRSYFGRPGGG